jgi:hypothetical protein
MGPVTTKFARVDPGPSQTFGWTAFGVSAVGIVLVLVSFTALVWERQARLKFVDLRNLIDRIKVVGKPQLHPLATAYFSWLAWLLLFAVALCAVLAATPTISGPFRVITPLVAAAAIALTFVAIDVTYGVPYRDSIKDTRAGFYLAIAGFLIAGVGATLGTRRERQF